MIPVNELRIGNYVESPLGEIMKVTILGDLKKPDYIHAKNNEGFGQNGFEPIPLTPEILEKCGFVKTKDKYSTYWKLIILRTEVISIEDDGSFGLNAENESSSQGYAGSPIIKNLHQLQNLYFALTGEELNINL